MPKLLQPARCVLLVLLSVLMLLLASDIESDAASTYQRNRGTMWQSDQSNPEAIRQQLMQRKRNAELEWQRVLALRRVVAERKAREENLRVGRQGRQN